MSKVITLKLSRQSIDKAIKEVKDYQKWLEDGLRELVNEMAKEGVTIAQANFEQAQYDGVNDAVVTEFSEGHGKAVIQADGNSVLFIEFGTGVTYADDHPEAAVNGMIRGGYGSHLGLLRDGWRYYGDPGTNGTVYTTGSHAGMVHTYGNPANMSMYLTARELASKFSDIARRVFAS